MSTFASFFLAAVGSSVAENGYWMKCEEGGGSVLLPRLAEVVSGCEQPGCAPAELRARCACTLLLVNCISLLGAQRHHPIPDLTDGTQAALGWRLWSLLCLSLCLLSPLGSIQHHHSLSHTALPGEGL